MKIIWEINGISIVTVVISIAALFITLKNRRNAIRENLYNRQLNILQSLFNEIYKYELLLDDLDVELDYQKELEHIEDEDEKKDVEKKISEIEDELIKTADDLTYELSKAQLFLPDEITEEFYRFLKDFNKIHGPVFKKRLTEKQIEEFGDKIFDLEKAVRDYIGLENLSKENRRLVK